MSFDMPARSLYRSSASPSVEVWRKRQVRDQRESLPLDSLAASVPRPSGDAFDLRSILCLSTALIQRYAFTAAVRRRRSGGVVCRPRYWCWNSRQDVSDPLFCPRRVPDLVHWARSRPVCLSRCDISGRSAAARHASGSSPLTPAAPTADTPSYCRT